MIDTTKDFAATVSIQTPMGPLKVLVDILWNNETSFSGRAKLLGNTNTFTDGVRTDDRLDFDITVKVPFGKLDIHVNVTIDPEGKIDGVATMPHRKPMKINGTVNA